MKKLLIFTIFLLMIAIVSAASSPYPIYGTTSKNSKITVISEFGQKSVKSSSNGYYQIELNSDYKDITLVVKGCSKRLTLLQGPGLKYDMPCNIPSKGVMGGTGALIAAALVAYGYYKKKGKWVKKNAKNR
jgi:homoserine kinase